MNTIIRNRFSALLLVLAVLSLTVIGGDVIMQEGVITGSFEYLKSTDCTATGAKSVALVDDAEASGDYSVAIGPGATADDDKAVAIGWNCTASGYAALAAGVFNEASGYYSTALGEICHNSTDESFAVGFTPDGHTPATDFKVESGAVTVYGDLYVSGDVDADDYLEHSPFYDQQAHGSALAYLDDSSRTITRNDEGEKVYDHDADPTFLKKMANVKDYNTYTEEPRLEPRTNTIVKVRKYAVKQEVRGSLGMKVAWLRQCTYELKQENDALKAEIAAIKQAIGMK